MRWQLKTKIGETKWLISNSIIKPNSKWYETPNSDKLNLEEFHKVIESV